MIQKQFFSLRLWRCLLLVFLMAGYRPAAAQDRIKVRIQQILKLEILHELLQQNGRIVDDGLTLIGTIQDIDHALHRNYFQSWWQVKPSIGQTPGVQDLAARIDELYTQAGTLRRKVTTYGVWSAVEQAHLLAVLQTVTNDTKQFRATFQTIYTDGQAAFRDDQRVQQGAKLETDVTAGSTFLQSFARQISLLVIQRQRDLNSIHQLQTLLVP